MKCFKEQENGEQGDKFGRKIFSKHSESQTCFCDGIPWPVNKMLKF